METDSRLMAYDYGRVFVGPRATAKGPYVELLHQDGACYFIPSDEARALAMKLLWAATEAERRQECDECHTPLP